MRQKPGGLSSLEEQIIGQFEEGLKKYSKPHIAFTISFCDDGDLLSQWRGYGSFGSGYALGFQAEGFDAFQLGNLIEVQYGFEGVQEMALDLLSIFVEAEPKWAALLDRFSEEAAQVIRYLSLRFKSARLKRRNVKLGDADRSKRQAWAPFRSHRPLKFRARGADIVALCRLIADLCSEGRRVFTTPQGVMSIRLHCLFDGS